MKSPNQILLLALTFAFTVALSLAVALVCVSNFKEAPVPPNPDSESTETSREGTATSAEPESETQPVEEPSEGLVFFSNGDGTCTLKGIGSVTDACVVIPDHAPTGDRVTEIAERAFFGCKTVSAVQIPASVKQIGALAFADCPNLVYISVSLQNTAFCDLDGILYTADLSTLILYPPMRAGQSLTIRTVTSAISDMAFYGCVHLEKIHYTGSPEDWERIRIGIRNYSLIAAAKSFAE